MSDFVFTLYYDNKNDQGTSLKIWSHVWGLKTNDRGLRVCLSLDPTEYFIHQVILAETLPEIQF
jgi:hypothetical protein